MSFSVKSRLAMVFCIIILLLSSNVGYASARRLGFHKHHHKVAFLVHGGGKRRVLGGIETGEVVVMDYPQPHRKPPIHNEKA
ncbi:Protein GOLVEN 1 [Hirschfeldia incana]|nr:Protein GOLVEN 1 [Hirschfeldia incana]